VSSRPAPTSAPLLLRMLEERHHRDADDRPLCEVRTPPEHLRPGDLIHRACPYPGSRHGRPMNVAALAQMSSHWDDVVDTLALLRTRYAAPRPEAAPELLDVWRVSQFAASLPWFFLLRRDQAIPGFAAALAKATQGVGLWAQRVLVERLAGGPAPAITAAAIAASAEATGLLVGEVEACAGSEAMIRRFLEALLTGRPRAEGPAVAALAAAGDEVVGFAAHYTNLKLVWWLLALGRRFVYADLAAAVPAGHPLGAALVELRDGPGDPPDLFLFGPAEPAAVARPARGAWLTGLAGLVEPLAPDGSDRVLGAVARAVAGAVGAEEPPARDAHRRGRHYRRARRGAGGGPGPRDLRPPRPPPRAGRHRGRGRPARRWHRGPLPAGAPRPADRRAGPRGRDPARAAHDRRPDRVTGRRTPARAQIANSKPCLTRRSYFLRSKRYRRAARWRTPVWTSSVSITSPSDRIFLRKLRLSRVRSRMIS
jgi:hypothetical protein